MSRPASFLAAPGGAEAASGAFLRPSARSSRERGGGRRNPRAFAHPRAHSPGPGSEVHALSLQNRWSPCRTSRRAPAISSADSEAANAFGAANWYHTGASRDSAASRSTSPLEYGDACFLGCGVMAATSPSLTRVSSSSKNDRCKAGTTPAKSRRGTSDRIQTRFGDRFPGSRNPPVALPSLPCSSALHAKGRGLIEKPNERKVRRRLELVIRANSSTGILSVSPGNSASVSMALRPSSRATAARGSVSKGRRKAAVEPNSALPDIEARSTPASTASAKLRVSRKLMGRWVKSGPWPSGWVRSWI